MRVKEVWGSVQKRVKSKFLAALAAILITFTHLYIQGNIVFRNPITGSGLEDLKTAFITLIAWGLLWLLIWSLWRVWYYKSQNVFAGIMYLSEQNSESERSEMKQEIQIHAERSNSIDILVSTGNFAIINDTGSGKSQTPTEGFLYNALRTGNRKTRVIMQAPYCPAAINRAECLRDGQIARKETVTWDTDRYCDNILSVQFRLAELHSRGHNVEQLMTTVAPAFRLIMFDHIAFVQHYPSDREGRESIIYGFTRDNPSSLYHSYRSYFESYWSHLSNDDGAQVIVETKTKIEEN